MWQAVQEVRSPCPADGREHYVLSLAAQLAPDLDVRDVSAGWLSGLGTEENEAKFTYHDPALTPDRATKRCPLCENDLLTCTYHSFHVEVPEPWLLPQFEKQAGTALSLVCKQCGSCLWDTAVLAKEDTEPAPCVADGRDALSEEQQRVLLESLDRLTGLAQLRLQVAHSPGHAAGQDEQAWAARWDDWRACAEAAGPALLEAAGPTVLACPDVADLSRHSWLLSDEVADAAAAAVGRALPDPAAALGAGRAAVAGVRERWNELLAPQHRHNKLSQAAAQRRRTDVLLGGVLLARLQQVWRALALAAGQPFSLAAAACLALREAALAETLLQRLQKLAHAGVTRRLPHGLGRELPPALAPELRSAGGLREQLLACRARLAVLGACRDALREWAVLQGVARGLPAAPPVRGLGSLAPGAAPGAAYMSRVLGSALVRKRGVVRCAAEAGGCGCAQPRLTKLCGLWGEVQFRGAAQAGRAALENLLGWCWPRPGGCRAQVPSAALRAWLAAAPADCWARAGLPAHPERLFRFACLVPSRALLPVVQAGVDGRQVLLSYGHELADNAHAVADLLRCCWEVRLALECHLGGRAWAGGAGGPGATPPVLEAGALWVQGPGCVLTAEYLLTLTAAYNRWCAGVTGHTPVPPPSPYSAAAAQPAAAVPVLLRPAEGLRSLSELWSRKDGEFRKNGLGKRINCSARGVLIGIATVPVGHVMVGWGFLRTQFECVRVTAQNVQSVRAKADLVQRARARLRDWQALVARLRHEGRTAEAVALRERNPDLLYGDVYPALGLLWQRPRGARRAAGAHTPRASPVFNPLPFCPPLLLDELAAGGDGAGRGGARSYSDFIHVGDVLEMSLTQGSKVLINRQPTLSPQSARVFSVLVPRTELLSEPPTCLAALPRLSARRLAVDRPEFAPQHFCLALNPIEEIPFNGDNDGDVITLVALQDPLDGWSADEAIGSCQHIVSRAAAENVTKLALDNLNALSAALREPGGAALGEADVLSLRAQLERHAPAPPGYLRPPPGPARPGGWTAWDVLGWFLPLSFVSQGQAQRALAAGRWDEPGPLGPPAPPLGQGREALVKLLYSDYAPQWAAFFLDCVSVFVAWLNRRRALTLSLADLAPAPGAQLPAPPGLRGLPPAGGGGGGGPPVGDGAGRRPGWVRRERRLAALLAADLGAERDLLARCARHAARLRALAQEHQRAWLAAPHTRGIMSSIVSGAKGSLEDVQQLQLQAGMHLYAGSLIEPSVGGRRSVYSRPGSRDDTGFVRESFLAGLSLRSFGWHMAASREVVGQNVRTVATTGYFQHSLNFVLQGAHLAPPGLLVRGRDCIIDFPGRLQDGLHWRPVRSRLAELLHQHNQERRAPCSRHPLLPLCLERRARAAAADDDDDGLCGHCRGLWAAVRDGLGVRPAEAGGVRRSVTLFARQRWRAALVHPEDVAWTPQAPFGLPELAVRVRRGYPRLAREPALAPDRDAARAHELVERAVLAVLQSPDEHAWSGTQAYLSSELTAHRAAGVYALSLGLLEALLKQVVYCCGRSSLHFGHSLGGLAASSYGHLGTQLTLNTRHKASSVMRSTEGLPRILALTRLQQKQQDYFVLGRVRSWAEIERWRAVDPEARGRVQALHSGSAPAEFVNLFQQLEPYELCLELRGFPHYHQELRAVQAEAAARGQALWLYQQDRDLDAGGGRVRRQRRAGGGRRAGGALVSPEGCLLELDGEACGRRGLTHLLVVSALRAQLPAFMALSAWVESPSADTVPPGARLYLFARLVRPPPDNTRGSPPRPRARPAPPPAEPPATPAPARRLRASTYQYNSTELFCTSVLRRALVACWPATGVAQASYDRASCVLSLALHPGQVSLERLRKLLARPEWVPETVEFSDPSLAYQLLGIEAAALCLRYELGRSLAGIGGLSQVHTETLSRVMTHTGTLLPVSRSGYEKLEQDPFEKSLFERNGRTFLGESLGRASCPESSYWSFFSGRPPPLGDAFFRLRQCD